MLSVVCSTEKEFEEKLKQLQAKHAGELGDIDTDAVSAAPAESSSKATQEQPPEEAVPIAVDPEEEARQRKIEKARRKREKQREKEQQREREIAEETANAGPSPRDVENAQIMQRLTPLNLEIAEVAADGHCLYRAVGAHLGQTFDDVRTLCASTLQEHADDFMPFCEYTEVAPDFDAYVNQVKSSAEWGGHLELRALSLALKKQVHVYSANSPTALVIGQDEVKEDDSPIRLSYHLHYYALGEHYNQVVPKS